MGPKSARAELTWSVGKCLVAIVVFLPADFMNAIDFCETPRAPTHAFVRVCVCRC